MKKSQGHPRSHLFTVQVWNELVGTEQTEVQGKVQLLTTGEARYFRAWTALVPLLVTMLSEVDGEQEANQ